MTTSNDQRVTWIVEDQMRLRGLGAWHAEVGLDDSIDSRHAIGILVSEAVRLTRAMKLLPVLISANIFPPNVSLVRKNTSWSRRLQSITTDENFLFAEKYCDLINTSFLIFDAKDNLHLLANLAVVGPAILLSVRPSEFPDVCERFFSLLEDLAYNGITENTISGILGHLRADELMWILEGQFDDGFRSLRIYGNVSGVNHLSSLLER